MYRQSQVKEDCSQEEGGGAVFERWFKGRIPLVNHSLVTAKGPAELKGSYESCCAGATPHGWVRVESSIKTWSTGGGNGKALQYSCHENPMNSMKRKKDMTLEDDLSSLKS